MYICLYFDTHTHMHTHTHTNTHTHTTVNLTQGWVLAAFYYGYVVMQVPGGWLAQRFGGKYVFGIGIVMTAVLTLFTPLAAQINIWALVVLRVVEGLLEVKSFFVISSLSLSTISCFPPINLTLRHAGSCIPRNACPLG